MSQIEAVSPEPLDVAVGRRVHMLMWEQRITQTQLGRRIGVDQSGLGRRLRGERGWSLDDLAATARELGVSMAYLLGESDSTKPRPDGPDGAREEKLPGLDSNQEPIGSQPGMRPIVRLIPLVA